VSWPRYRDDRGSHGRLRLSRESEGVPRVLNDTACGGRRAVRGEEWDPRGRGSAAAKIAPMRDCTACVLSPEQIVATYPELGLPGSTGCERVDRGYGDTSNIDLRGKVGHGPRHHAGDKVRVTWHSPERSHEAFLGLLSSFQRYQGHDDGGDAPSAKWMWRFGPGRSTGGTLALVGCSHGTASAVGGVAARGIPPPRRRGAPYPVP
jgi:hypothetical protein